MQNVTSEQIVKSLSNVFKVSLKVMGGFTSIIHQVVSNNWLEPDL